MDRYLVLLDSTPRKLEAARNVSLGKSLCKNVALDNESPAFQRPKHHGRRRASRFMAGPRGLAAWETRQPLTGAVGGVVSNLGRLYARVPRLDARNNWACMENGTFFLFARRNAVTASMPRPEQTSHCWAGSRADADSRRWKAPCSSGTYSHSVAKDRSPAHGKGHPRCSFCFGSYFVHHSTNKYRHGRLIFSFPKILLHVLLFHPASGTACSCPNPALLANLHPTASTLPRGDIIQ